MWCVSLIREKIGGVDFGMAGSYIKDMLPGESFAISRN